MAASRSLMTMLTGALMPGKSEPEFIPSRPKQTKPRFNNNKRRARQKMAKASRRRNRAA